MSYPLYFYLFIYCIFGCVYMSCDFNSRHYNRGWGLKSIELKKEVEFRKEAYQQEILFIPRISSKKYEFRLFYPSINPSQISFSELDSIEENIWKFLDGFSYIAYDVNENKQLKEYIIDISKGYRGYSFNTNNPVSLWMDVKLHFKKNRKYKIVLKIPPARTDDPKYLNVVFVIGIAHDVFL